MAGSSAIHAVLVDDDWGSAAVECDLLLEEDVATASGQTVEPDDLATFGGEHEGERTALQRCYS